MNSKIIPIDFGKRDSQELIEFVINEAPEDVVICYTTNNGDLMKIVSSIGSTAKVTGQLFMMLQQVSAPEYEE